MCRPIIPFMKKGSKRVSSFRSLEIRRRYILLLAVFAQLVLSSTSTSKIEPKPIERLTRISINDTISMKEHSFDRISLIMKLPSKENNYGSEIIEEALDQKVPVNLVLSLVYAESEFNYKAYNENIKNGIVVSIDRGLFQLNNNSFPELKRDDFYNPKRNMKVGISYLKFLYERFGTWEKAVLAYNCGPFRLATEGAPTKTKAYLKKILEKERELDNAFNDYHYREFSNYSKNS